MRPWLLTAVVAIIVLLGGAVGAETVRLKSGNIITGEILADKAEFVAVDLGYTVLEIPRRQVAGIEEETTEAPEAAAETDQKTLYLTAKLKPRTVKELVATFGQGLVKVQTPKAIGSGFFINEQGHVITNAHVIQGETRISVNMFIKQQETFSRRTVREVKIVAVNPAMDLALLKVDVPEDLEATPLFFGEMDRVKTGDPVFAIGNPFGMERSVSEGIVSHKARHTQQMLLIQTTAPINPGNSGGPLLNMRGEVIGVTNMKLAFIAEGMGFAVPINYVKDFLKFHEAYAYDKDNPNAGYQYLEPPHKRREEEKEGAEENEEPDGNENPQE